MYFIIEHSLSISTHFTLQMKKKVISNLKSKYQVLKSPNQIKKSQNRILKSLKFKFFIDTIHVNVQKKTYN